MNSNFFKSSVILLGLLLLTACGKTYYPPQGETLLDRNWGRAYETVKHYQILNPDAGKNPTPVVGMDGLAAEKNLEKYRKTFQGESTQQSINLNLEGLGGTGE